MPSVSPEQAKTMAAIAHGWKPSNPKLARVPLKVAKEFNQADKGSGIRREHDAQAKALQKMGGKS